MRNVDAYFLTPIRYGAAAAVLIATLRFCERKASLYCEGKAPWSWCWGSWELALAC